MMNYHVYMLVHCLGAFVDGANPTKRTELLANCPVLMIPPWLYSTKCSLLGAMSERFTLDGISQLYCLHSRSRLFRLH